MADFNENININVKSDTKQAVRDINAFNESLKKMQSTMQKTEVSTRSINKWVKQLENVANPIEFANKQMDRLNKKLTKAQSGVEVKRITKDQVALMTATGQSKNFQSAYRQESGIIKAQQALAEFERRLDPTKQKLYQLEQILNQNRQKFVELASSGRNTGAVEKSIKKVTAQMQKLEESTKKTSNKFAVLWGRIKNIAVYRTIRRTIQIIFQTITKGFQRVTELNKDAEKLALRLKADYNLLATAIGVTLYTVLKSFTSQVDDLTDTLINYINAFNRGIAVVSGQDKYLKVVRKDIDAINRSVNNLSFDKFESLTKGNENTNGVGLVETVVGENPTQVEAEMEGLVKLLSGAFDAIKPILQSALYVAGEILKIISTILRTGIIQFIVDLSAKVIEVTDNAGLLKALIVSLIALAIITKINAVITAIVAMTASIKALVAGVLIFLATFTFVDSLLDSFSGTAKMVVSAVLMIVGALVAVYTAIQLVKHAWTGFGAIALAVASGAVALAGLKGLVEVASEPPAVAYANGGIPEKSELFYMNENGVPEALVNTGGSQTNVINIDQLSEGMRRGFVQAIYDTGLIDAMETRLVVDGSSVNDNAFARAIFPALKTESRRRGGNQL